MKSIINKDSGEVLYCTFLDVNLAENEILIEQIATAQFYNFETQEFYDK